MATTRAHVSGLKVLRPHRRKAQAARVKEAAATADAQSALGRRAEERAGGASEERSLSLLRTVLDATVAGFLSVDVQGAIQTYNREFLRLWSLTEAALATSAGSGEPVMRAVLPKIKEPAPFAERLVELDRDPEGRYDGTVELVDGRVVEFHSLPQRLGDAATVIGRVWSFRDVTDRVRAEGAVRQSEALFKVAFGAIPDLAAIVDRETRRVLEVNEGWEHVLGWRREEVVGRTVAELPIWLEATRGAEGEAQRERVLEVVERAGAIPELDLELRRRDGPPCHVAGLARAAEIGGRPVAVVLLRDRTARWRLEEDLRQLNADLELRVRERTADLEREVAERKRSQASLRQNERKYRELVESANSIILRWDTRGRVTFLNEFGQSFFGFREEEILGRSVIGTIVPQTESSGRDLIELMAQVTGHPEKFVANENENVRSDGARVWIAWTNRPVNDQDGRLSEVLSVGNDISQLKSVERELVKAKEAAESADRLKSAFLATMSHELRTPLNSILGFTGILLQGLAGPLNAEQSYQLGMVQTSARHLHSLICDVLDLSKIEAGQLRVDRAPFDFRAAATRVLREVQPLAANKGLQLRMELAPEVGPMVGDARRMEQILLNLLSNAIKFTEQGEVEVTSRIVDDGWLETSVRDTGIGIKPEDQAHLFRPFQQVDIGLTRKHEGTGLGLSICAKLIGLLGGSIGFRSTFGEGSVFSFRVPTTGVRGGEDQ